MPSVAGYTTASLKNLLRAQEREDGEFSQAIIEELRTRMLNGEEIFRNEH